MLGGSTQPLPGKHGYFSPCILAVVGPNITEKLQVQHINAIWIVGRSRDSIIPKSIHSHQY